MKRLNIVKIIDQWGWSYDFIGREQKRYSQHNIIISKYDEIDYKDVDVLYLHSPNIDPIISNNIPLIAKERGIKVIGGYGGNPNFWPESTPKKYSHSDLIVTISPKTYRFASLLGLKIPVIFLPESIDTLFFKQKQFSIGTFNIGWAGSNFAIKRQDILDELKYSVIRQSQWGFDLFKKDRPLEYMIDFYHSLDVFVLTSITECMPRVILEAMSCGLPVVATDVGCIPFLIDKEWIVPVNPKETVIEEMNKRLDLLKENPELRKKVGERNRRYVEENFSWKVNQPMWDKTFYDLANNNLDEILEDNVKYLKKYQEHFPEHIRFNKPKIAYVLPGTSICGGIAVILQHANRLWERGYNAILISQNLDEEILWFLNKVPIISAQTEHKYLLEDIDILVMTGWDTVTNTGINFSAKRKIYFVQSDERRFFDDVMMKRLIHGTYELNIDYMTEALWIQRWLKEEFGHDAYYVPNGLDEKLFYPAEPLEPKTSKPRILLEGAISTSFKGVAEAYEAIKDLDCEIWIVSNSGQPKLGWKYKRFFENIPMDRMKNIYSSCDILLKLSRVEGFFGPPMEAMACGCAVIVGKCTGYDEYIKHDENALVVLDSYNIISVRETVQRLLSDKKLYQKLIQNGFETVKKWNWDKSIDYLEDAIKAKGSKEFYSISFPEIYDYSVERNLLKDRTQKEDYCDIIIVSFNAVDYLKRTIESIKKHTRFPYKIVIVDNNSNYETISFLNSLKNDKEIEIIFNSENFGFGFACNQGFRKGKSKYVCFLNSDIIVTDFWLNRLIEIFEKKINTGMVGPKTNYVSLSIQKSLDFQYQHNVFNNDDNYIQNFAKEKFEKYQYNSDETIELIGFCLLTKREILNSIGEFDERFRPGNFEDNDLSLRFIERGYKLYVAKGVFIYHFGGESFQGQYKQKTNTIILDTNRKLFEEKWHKSKRIEQLSYKRNLLNIVYLLASDSATGGVKVVFEQANRLKARGHNVKIICSQRESSNWFDVHVPIIYEKLDNVPNCDIAIGTYFTTLPYLKKIKARVKIHLCQGYEALLHSDQGLINVIKSNYAMIKNKIVVSPWLKQILDKEYSIDCNFVSNGIDPYIYSFSEHKRNRIPRILITGSTHLGIKGVNIALEAVKATNQKIEIVRLAPDSGNRYEQFEHYNMSKMTQKEIAQIYESCDVTICSSFKVEGFSLHPLESMASGTPVITTDNGGVNTYAKSNINAIIVPPGNPQIITHQLHLLLDNKQLYNSLLKNGIETAKEYFWYRKIDELESLLYKMFNSSLKIENDLLSVCMIVKNEEQYLANCLNSIKDIASEIVIIDTGSTDNTIQIAKSYGASVYHYDWDNNFSNARNFAISKCSCSWIFVIDADETISKKDISKFNQLLNKEQNVTYNFDTRNYTNNQNVQNLITSKDEYEEGKDYIGWCKSSKIRLFPSNKNIKFSGRIHELVESSIKLPIIESNIPIHHYGFLRKENNQKQEKYLELEKKKVEEEQDLKSIVELAVQYMSLNNHDEALVFWRKALEQQPQNPDFLAKIGTTYNLLEDFERAEKFFLKSLAIKETDYAYQHLGICYAKLNKYDKAYKAFKNIVYMTNDLQTMGNFACCCNELKKFDESIVILEKAIRINRQIVSSWGLLELAYNEKGIELAKNGKLNKALSLFNSALKISPNFRSAQLNIMEINKLLKKN